MSNQMIKALVVDDDPIARTVLVKYLRDQGCYIEGVDDARSAMTALTRNTFDVIFIDLYMPGDNGHTLCKKLHGRMDIGIIFTSSCEDSIEKIVALESGADTYYTKPLPMREVYAYTKNLVQRLKDKRKTTNTSQKLLFKNWHFSAEEQSIKSSSGEQITLTKNETRILEFMIEHADLPLKREQLGSSIGRSSWNVNDRSIDVLIGKLRNKITQISGNNQQIKTQYGIGYVFCPEH